VIPLRDNIPSRTTPFVNYTMIGLCAVAFLLQQGTHGNLIYELGMVPHRVLGDGEGVVAQQYERIGSRILVREGPAPDALLPPWLTVLTCIFLHGGWLHFLGNMLFLWIFGDNVEDRMGHVGYAGFYLLSGVAASAAHLVTNAESTIPTVGASGAIAGVMGAYFYLYPRAQVLTLVPLGFILTTFVLPAPVLLGIWFLLQLLNTTLDAGSAGGVAWWAHIGGFVFGVLVALALGRSQRLRPAVTDRRIPRGRTVQLRRYDPRLRR